MNQDWYVVCRFTTTRRVAAEVVPWPASVAHAKQMGTSATACGQNSSTWIKLFHVDFPASMGESCPVCLEIVSVASGVRPRQTGGFAEGGQRA